MASRPRSAARPRGAPRPAATSRVRLATDTRRAELLAVATKLFRERPYDEVAIEDVAQEAGVSKALLFHYFGSKKTLYGAVIQRAADELLEATAIPPELPPLERLERGIVSYLAFVAKHRKAWIHLMRSGVGADRELARIVDGTREVITSRIEQGLPLPVTPTLRTVLRGYVGFAETATLQALEEGTFDPARLGRLFHAVLVALLQVGATVGAGAGAAD